MVDERHGGLLVSGANRPENEDHNALAVEGDATPPPPGRRRANRTERRSSWVGQNWDKVLMGALSVIVSGIIGFFAAIRVVDSQIPSLKEEVAYLKADNKASIRRDEIIVLIKDIEHLRNQIAHMSTFEPRLDKVEEISSFAITQYTAILGNQLQILQFRLNSVNQMIR